MWPRRRRLRWPIVVLVAVVLVGSGTAYAVTADGSAGSYRTVRATKGDVEQTLQTSGTVDAAERADLEFATSGTVAKVEVAVGSTVKTRQVVAVLDADELRAAVTRAEAAVAKAVAQLASDRNAQDATVAAAAATPKASSGPEDAATPSSGGSSHGSPGNSSGGSSGSSSGTAAALNALKAEQDAVIKAQGAATAAITAAKDALTAQTEACAAAYQDPTPATSTPSDDPTPGADDTAAKAAATSADDSNAACTAALSEVQHRQADVSDAQDALATALSRLGASLTRALASLAATSRPTSSGATPSRSTPTESTSTSSTPSGATRGAGSADGSSSGTVTAARLAADQAQIEQANAELVAARQQLSQAVVRSTRSGKVVALDATKGAKVSAGDTAAVVVGGRAVTVVASIDESRIDQVRVGQKVQVTTPGESDDAEGTVTAIGLVADSSSGSATYPVTVTVEDPAISLPTGSRAMLAIVVATATDVVTVPTSAVTRRADGAVVQVWDGKQLTRKSVTVGTVGTRLVEVTGGLSAGEEVVLADLDQPITGASDTINERGGFSGNRQSLRSGGGGIGGGGAGGGGRGGSFATVNGAG